MRGQRAFGGFASGASRLSEGSSSARPQGPEALPVDWNTLGHASGPILARRGRGSAPTGLTARAASSKLGDPALRSRHIER